MNARMSLGISSPDRLAFRIILEMQFPLPDRLRRPAHMLEHDMKHFGSTPSSANFGSRPASVTCHRTWLPPPPLPCSRTAAIPDCHEKDTAHHSFRKSRGDETCRDGPHHALKSQRSCSETRRLILLVRPESLSLMGSVRLSGSVECRSVLASMQSHSTGGNS